MEPAYQAEDLAKEPADAEGWHLGAMRHLLTVVQELSQVHTLDEVVLIVRDAARHLVGADGATFVLRDGDSCYYLEESAISPLWKGRRFPIAQCISGWAMINRQPAVIEDIYSDARIPIDAYKATFVKSLAMVPIRRAAPIGAIGAYWAARHRPSDEEVEILQALADTASVAIANAQLYEQLQAKVNALQESNYELGRFAWVASHDLQEPLRNIVTQVELLERRCTDQLDSRGREYVRGATDAAIRLQNLIQDLLVHAGAEKMHNFRPVALSDIVMETKTSMRSAIEEAGAVIRHAELPWVWGDPAMLLRLFQNLLSNAVKFRRSAVQPEIIIGSERHQSGWHLWVKDNGIGISPTHHQNIFELFRRLHPQERFPGSGIGLATCKKIVELHGGNIWLESELGHGSTFHFILPATTLPGE